MTRTPSSLLRPSKRFFAEIFGTYGNSPTAIAVRSVRGHVRRALDERRGSLKTAAATCGCVWILSQCLEAGMSMRTRPGHLPLLAEVGLSAADVDTKIEMMALLVGAGADRHELFTTDMVSLSVSALLLERVEQLKRRKEQTRETQRTIFELELLLDVLAEADMPPHRHVGNEIFRMDDIALVN